MNHTRSCEFHVTALRPSSSLYSPITHSLRELQELIDSTSESSSPFHLSHAAPSTDTTVYPPPALGGPETKKRKLDSGAPANGVVSGQMNDAQHAKHPGMMTSNKHTIAIHERLKRECETLAELCVRMVITYLLVHGLSRLLGQGQALD